MNGSQGIYRVNKKLKDNCDMVKEYFFSKVAKIEFGNLGLNLYKKSLGLNTK